MYTNSVVSTDYFTTLPGVQRYKRTRRGASEAASIVVIHIHWALRRDNVGTTSTITPNFCSY